MIIVSGDYDTSGDDSGDYDVDNLIVHGEYYSNGDDRDNNIDDCGYSW